MAPAEPQPEENGAKPAQPQTAKVRKALSQVKRELSAEELTSPGVQKMLVEELERVEDENSEFRSFRDQFHKVDKDLAVLQGKQKIRIGAEIVSGACLAVGAAAVGYAPGVWGVQPTGVIVLVFGAVLTILGIIAKAVML